ncbi:MAG TPA: helix-turn-helix domain-containing protein [Pyrinomonadaceae bacterium]|nr:helix-turn-helix domain-containing protein [Pyrinomonadaceae bacterium]
MSPNISLIKALVTTLGLEVDTLVDADADVIEQPIDLYKKVRDYEAKIIRAALIKTGGNQRRAAEMLNLKTSTLNTKIKQFGIDMFHFKAPMEVDRGANKSEYAM